MAEQIQSLRQVALITRDLDESVRFWTTAFGLEECFRDDLTRYGLSNVLLPIGDTFLELLQVDRPDSAGARYLERHGEGLYMAVFQVNDVCSLAQTLAEQDVPVVERIARPQHQALQVHPKCLGGVFGSFEHGSSPEEWPAAGSDWRSHVRTDLVSRIAGAAFMTDDVDREVGRWHRLFGAVPARYYVLEGLRIAQYQFGDGKTAIDLQQPLDLTGPEARYLQRHGPGMYYWALRTPDLDRVLARAQTAGAQVFKIDEHGIGGRTAWLHPRSTHGVLTEIVQEA